MFQIGGSGNDTIVGSATDDLIDGGAGDDVLSGLGGSDALYGGDGFDDLTGGGGIDLLYGEEGNDILNGGAGADELDGGRGIDAVSYGGSTVAVTVDLINGGLFGEAQGDTYISIEWVSGSSSDDSLYGNDLNNGFLDGGGNDFIDGRGGADLFVVNLTTDPLTSLPVGTTTLFGPAAVLFAEQLGVLLPQPDAGIAYMPVWDPATSTFKTEYDILVNIENLGGNDGDDTLSGNGQDNVLYASRGDDLLDGGAGFDYVSFNDPLSSFDLLVTDWSVDLDLAAGVGTIRNQGGVMQGTSLLSNIEAAEGTPYADGLFGDIANNRLDGMLGNDVLAGRGGDDHLAGGKGDDFLQGGVGNDLLEGGLGADAMDGGQGLDTVTYENSLDGVWASLLTAKGKLLIRDGVDQVDGEAIGDRFLNIENIIGSAESDYLEGNNRTNTMAGGNGKDEIHGGGGDDVIYGDYAPVAVHLNPAQSLQDDTSILDCDTLLTPPALATNAIVQNLPLDLAAGGILVPTNSFDVIDGGAGNDYLAGQAGTDLLLGECGNDTLLGGNQVDLLFGGIGDDLLEGGPSFDFLFGDLGFDTASYSLSSSAVNVNLTNPSQISGGDTTSDLINELLMMFLSATDATTTFTSAITLSVIGLLNNAIDSNPTTSQALRLPDVLFSVEGLIGSAFADTLTGSVVGNRLDGGLGADTMSGLAGNDTYVVDNPADLVVEVAAQGRDTVESGISYTLPVNVEDLVLTSPSNSNGTGNALNNVIFAGAGVNVINGGVGTDTISFAKATTAGITGVTLDLSLVNVAGESTASGISGADRVRNIENVTGSNYNDALTGNGGANLLDGGLGDDALAGGLGNDTYVVNSLGDLVSETSTLNTEIDTVRASISWTLGANLDGLHLLGIDAINGTGNGRDNTLIGNDAANTLAGRAGNDTLTGGLGSDSFIFNTAPSAITNRDTLTDFVSATDSIRLDNAVFTALGVVGGFSAADVRFHAAAGATSGHDANDRIVYNTSTGALYYDADGFGALAAVQIALLGTVTHPLLAATDLVVV